MIVFNKPPVTGSEQEYVLEAIRSEKISGDGPFAQKCQNWFNKKLYPAKTLLTPSCTAALEMAAMLIDIKPGDEVIMPSYTFVSTANAFVLRGAKIIFVDIRPDTCNIDEEKILFDALLTVNSEVEIAVSAEQFEEAMACLSSLRTPIDNFFDMVTVNSDEQSVRVNRLELLSQIRTTMNLVVEFSKIEG